MSSRLFPAFEALRKTHPEIALELLETQSTTVLGAVRNCIESAGIDIGIYDFMKRDIIAGNFDVIYLDDRVVRDIPSRISAKKELDRIRTVCNTRKAKGCCISDILYL